MSTSRLRWALVLACLAAYGTSLRMGEYFGDDRAIIAENPVLRAGLRAAPRLLMTGYWDAVQANAGLSQPYRPLLMLSFLVQTATTGLRTAPLHAVNMLLHLLACLLLHEIVRKKMDPAAAAFAALVYAVMPIHAEAVSILTGRSEVLSCALLLASWLCLEDPSRAGRLWLGLACYAAALLTKESSILFPAFLALSDWTFRRQSPLHPQRRRVQELLLLLSAAYLALRLAVLSQVINGGISYFAPTGKLAAVLTLSRFAVLHYLWPSLSGLGLCTDYSRPFFADSAPDSLSSWTSLAALAGLFAFAAYRCLTRRSPWAFWLIGPSLFLLPTSHLLFAMCIIGADRFLYIPTIGLAVGLGHLYLRLKKLAPLAASLFAVVIPSWYAYTTIRRNKSWESEIGFYEAALACNPVSVEARSTLGSLLIMKSRWAEGTAHLLATRSYAILGGSLLQAGRFAEGKQYLLKAVAERPETASSYYNLGRLAWEGKDPASSEAFLRKAVSLNPNSSDGWVLLATVLESRGKLDEALNCFEKALKVWYFNPTAHFDLGRHYLLRKDPKRALPHLSLFLELAPEDPQAGEVRSLVSRLNREKFL